MRRFAANAWKDPDSRSVVIGVLAVLLVHAILFVAAPYLLRSDVSHALLRKHAAPRQFNIEIAPNEFVTPPPKPPPPNRYVEANRTISAPRTSSSRRRSPIRKSMTTRRS
jgi:hypothetical protein